jgi:hypothetical protein
MTQAPSLLVRCHLEEVKVLLKLVRKERKRDERRYNKPSQVAKREQLRGEGRGDAAAIKLGRLRLLETQLASLVEGLTDEAYQAAGGR